MSKPAIQVENLSKAYQLGQIGTGTISQDLERFWITKILGKEDPFLRIGETNDRSTKGDSNIVWSLKDINFTINQGDAVGIIGKNGAGKSTLLKLLSRVTAPTSGQIKVKGRIASLLEVGTGFHPELSGRENIYLNGAILGMRKKEIDRKFDEIVDFAGVERYIDTPVKRYSSGMYVRLAFAVAAHLESEILIVDEVLAVGDAEFQKKCLGKMGDISKGEGRTILFVSHNMGAVRNLCTSGILLDEGFLKASGNIDEITERYRHIGNSELKKYEAIKTSEIYLKTAEIDKLRSEFYSNETIKFNFEIENKINEISNSFILIRIMDYDEGVLFSSQTPIQNNKSNYELTINDGSLVKGRYSLSIYLYKPGSAPYDVVDNCCKFTILDNNKEYSHLETFNIGKVYISTNWK